MTSTEAL